MAVSPYEKTPLQAPVSELSTSKTACEWLIQQIGPVLQQTATIVPFSLLQDEKQIEQRWLLFLAPSSFPDTLLGMHAQEFILHASEKALKEEWGGPLLLQKIESVATAFLLLDKDLTDDPLWQPYWDTVTKAWQDTGSKEAGSVEKGVENLQKQVLAAYRLRVIQQSTFVTMTENQGVEQELTNIPIREFLSCLNFYLTQFSSKQCYEFLLRSCSKWLNEQRDKALVVANKAVKQGDFDLARAVLQQHGLLLHLSLSFEFLGSEMGGKILLPLKEKSQQYANVIQLIDEMIEGVSAQAIPGKDIEELIRQEVDKIKLTHPFKAMPELGPVAVARYLNRPVIIRKIYEKVLAARMNYYLPFLKKRDDGFSELRRELKKIIVYRSRRDVIAHLYQWVLSHPHCVELAKPDIREACLVMLQGEYLQTIHREVERMSHQSALIFLEQCREDPILQPLPRTRFFQLTKDLAQRELSLIIKNVHLLPVLKPREDVPLHNIDSPIEINILGEMTKELTEAVGAEHDELEDFSIIMEVLRKTQAQIKDPRFRPEPPLTEMLLQEGKCDVIKDKLLALDNLIQEKQMIVLYQILEKHFASGETKRSWFGRQSQYEKAKYLLQTLYMGSLKNKMDLLPCEKYRDKYILYFGLLLPARQTLFFQGEGEDTQALLTQWQLLVQSIMEKSVSPLPSI